MAEGIVPVKLLVENAAPSILVQFAIDGGMVPVQRKIRRFNYEVICLDQKNLKTRLR